MVNTAVEKENNTNGNSNELHENIIENVMITMGIIP